jgi:hypothetical protein
MDVLLRRSLQTLSLLALVACSEGYPTDDAAELDPSQMSQVQLIDALNRLGAKPHLAQRLRYSLEPECQLVIRARKSEQEDQRVVVEGALIEAVAVDDDIKIRVTPKGRTASDAVTVLVTSKWTDSAWIRSLLAHLGRSCEIKRAPAG